MDTRQSWREKEYTIEPGKVLEINLLDSQPNYCIVMNKSLTQLFVSRYARCSPTDYDFTVPANANRQWGWAESFRTLYVLNTGTEVISIMLTTYTAGFDPVSVAQTGNSVVVGNDINIASMPGVTIENVPAISIGSMPSVNIESAPVLNVTGSVSAAITSGNVNATIQNANIATQVVNTSGSPVNIQPPLQTLTNESTYDIGVAGGDTDQPIDKTYTILNSGGRLCYINLNFSNSTGYPVTFTIANNGNVLKSLTVSPRTGTSLELNYLNGIPNNGVTLRIQGTLQLVYGVSSSGYLLSS